MRIVTDNSTTAKPRKVAPPRLSQPQVPRCNLCGGTEFVDVKTRKAARCVTCQSFERTRVLKLFLDRHGLPRAGMRILHFAPEEGLSRLFAAAVGDRYQPVDLDPARYKHCKVGKFDLVSDAERLPSERYDMIVHVHVMEHVPCNWTAVMFHLHRALRQDGYHIFCLPIMGGHYEECLADLGAEENTRRFGQWDHIRRFGAKDIEKTLGMVFKLPAKYDLEEEFGVDTLNAHNIPRYSRFGMNCDTVLVMRKGDLKLTA